MRIISHLQTDISKQFNMTSSLSFKTLSGYIMQEASPLPYSSDQDA